MQAKGLRMNLYTLIIAVVSTEALTELIYGAEILNKPRAFVSRIALIGRLLECKYCTSVWVGLFVVIACMFFWDYTAVRLFCYSLCAHRLSNLFHVCVSALQEKIFDARINRKKLLDNIK